jgi:TonB family protein
VKEWNTAIPYTLIQRLVHAVVGVSISMALFYVVSLSLKDVEAPEEQKATFITQAVQLTPPPPPEMPKQKEEPEASITEKLQFSLRRNTPSIKLLQPNIRPTDAHNIVQKTQFDLSKFVVKGKDIDDMVVYEGRDVDRRPEALYRTMPKVTTKKKKETIRLIYVINNDGTVGDIYVTESGDPTINEEVIRTVKTWTYTPAMKGGTKVRCWVKQMIIINGGIKSAFSVN